MRAYKRLFVILSVVLATVAAAQEPHPPLQLNLATGTFRPLDPATEQPAAPEWFTKIAIDHSPGGQRYLVAITESSLSRSQRDALERSGAQVLGYLPVNGYRLRISPSDEARVRALPFVQWLGELPAHMKIAEGLAEPAALPAAPTALRVVLAPGEGETRLLQTLGSLTTSAAPSGPDGAWRVVALVPPSQLQSVLSQVAAFPEVEIIERVRPVRFLNQDGVWVHQSFTGPTPQDTPIFDQGIFGCDQVISVADSGQDHDVCYFRDSVNGAPPISICSSAPCPIGTTDLAQRKDIAYYNWSNSPTGDDDTCPTTLLLGSGHGTHTSGSALGDTAPYADCTTYTSPNRNGGDGQAPGAKLVMIELGDDIAFLNSMGGTIWNIADVAYNTGSRIHSFSLGGVCYDALLNCIPGCTLPYDSLARDADLAMWTYPDLLLINGAGNGGNYCGAPNSVVTPGLAKNVVTVGAVGHGVNANTVSSTSSPGPVFDGRLKPTLSAQGESVASAASDGDATNPNCGICQLSGTSMSAPTVAGLAALVREYYTAGFYSTGSRTPAQGLTPSGALIKATLIDSAFALGASAPAPNFDSGYGRVQLDSTLAFSGDPFALRAVDDRVGLFTGGMVMRAYDVAAGEPFRATLAWTDYPADLNAMVARVNELKLEVIDPNGNVWFQTLDGNGLPAQTQLPGDPHDPVNVEERLVFQTPTPGRWIVRVSAVDVAWGPQPFALVVRGALTDCPAPAAPTSLTFGTPNDQQVLVSWGTVPGAAAYNVYRSLGACGAGPLSAVAMGETGTTVLDTTVSGGTTYSYYVVATSDAEAYCESPPACDSVVPTGDCVVAPDFRGVTAAASDGGSTCSVTLEWDSATPYCGSQVRYNIYRDTTPGFSPSGANRIATCVSGTSYADTDSLVYGTGYHYVVRAEDTTTGHGGPCGGGNEEANVVDLPAAPDGPLAFGTWSDDAGDTSEYEFVLQSTWAVAANEGVGGSQSYLGSSTAAVCSDLVSPTLTLDGPGQSPTLTFTTKYEFEYDDGTAFALQGSLGQVEIAIGPDFTTWDRVELDGGYPTPTTATLNNCVTTQAAYVNYFTDRLLSYQIFSASLVQWAGLDVKLRFHIAGDLWWPTGQWWVDDIQVTQALVPGVCTTGTAGGGLPPIPDGASAPGAPLMVAKNGSNVDLSWDDTSCPTVAVNVYVGDMGDFSTFTSGHCSLPQTGAATLAIPNDSWFLVTATDGASADGSWSRDPVGGELIYGGASTVCPAITQHLPGTCP